MYKDFYGFSEMPFALTPDPKFLFLARSHFEALSSMISGILDRKGVIVVSGEAGVGKTTIIYALLKDLDKKLKIVFIFNPKLDFQQLLENILRELEVPLREQEKKLPFILFKFKKYLNERLTRDETLAVVIDEAQSLNEEVLKDLLRLSSQDTPGAKLLQTILVGHSELEAKMVPEKPRSFQNRTVTHRQIRPLTREEGRGYIRHRLNLVGRDISEIFTSEAVNRIWEFAGGIPRVMNLICDRALFIGYNNSSPLIDSKIVKEAIKDFTHLRPLKSEVLGTVLNLGKPSNRTLRIWILILSIGIFLLSMSKILTVIFRK